MTRQNPAQEASSLAKEPPRPHLQPPRTPKKSVAPPSSPFPRLAMPRSVAALQRGVRGASPVITGPAFRLKLCLAFAGARGLQVPVAVVSLLLAHFPTPHRGRSHPPHLITPRSTLLHAVAFQPPRVILILKLHLFQDANFDLKRIRFL